MNTNIKAIIDRARDIILKPGMTWEIIKGETTDLKQLYLNYAVPMAAIPILCGFIGLTLFGVHLQEGVVARAPFFMALLGAIIEYAFALASIFITAYLIDYLSQYFESKSDLISAAKLLIYSLTPIWVVGVFALFPSFTFLSIIGLYAGYILVVGLPVVLGTPAGKVPWFTAAIIVSWILISFIVNLIVVGLIYGPMYMRMLSQ